MKTTRSCQRHGNRILGGSYDRERRMVPRGCRNRREEAGIQQRGHRETGLILKPGSQEANCGVHGFPASELMILCSAIRGRVGDRVYKTYGDKLVVTRVPRFDGYVPSVAQRLRREKMRAATVYAQAVYADPAAKAVYVAAAKQLRRQPFRLAVSDFLRGHTRVTLDSGSH